MGISQRQYLQKKLIQRVSIIFTTRTYSSALSRYCFIPYATAHRGNLSVSLHKSHTVKTSKSAKKVHLPISTTSHLTRPPPLPFAPKPTRVRSQLVFAFPSRSKLGLSSLICLYCFVFLSVYGG